MPTPMTHAFVGASLSVTLPRSLRGLPATAGCAFLAASPDLDIVGFFLGVPYSNTFGHRGITHGLPFASLVSAGLVFLAICAGRISRKQSVHLFLGLAVIVGSHCILDMATNGGLGVGVLIPFWEDRLFLPFRPIEVSPIRPSRFLTDGFPVIVTELLWVWMPCITAVILIRSTRDHLWVEKHNVTPEGSRKIKL